MCAHYLSTPSLQCTCGAVHKHGKIVEAAPSADTQGDWASAVHHDGRLGGGYADKGRLSRRVAVRGNTGRPHLPDILEAMVRSDVGNPSRGDIDKASSISNNVEPRPRAQPGFIKESCGSMSNILNILVRFVVNNTENDDALNVLLNVSSSAPIKKQHRLY